MALEVATYIHQLVPTNPDGNVDGKSEGDDHIRMLKSTQKNTWPFVQGQVIATHTELNFLSGVGSAVLHAAQKNVANGVAGLDAQARVLNAQMPTDPQFVTSRLTSTVPVTLASGAHAFSIGAPTAANLAVSASDIQARSNGAASGLNLNILGGPVTIGGSAGGRVAVTSTGVEMYHAGALTAFTNGPGQIRLKNGTQEAALEMQNALNIRNHTTNALTALYGTNSSGILTAEATFDPNGAATLNYAGVAKLATASGGVAVTGLLTASSITTPGALAVNGLATLGGGVNIGATSLDEYSQDLTGGMFTGNSVSNISTSYDDTNGKISLTVPSGTTGNAGVIRLANDGEAPQNFNTIALTPSNLLQAFPKSLGINGYWNMPGGMQMRWGTVNVSAATTAPIEQGVSFAAAFSNAVLSVTLGVNLVSGGTVKINAPYYNSVTTSGMTIGISKEQTSGAFDIYYLAIGY